MSLPRNDSKASRANEKFSNVSKETTDAAYVFISFCELEKRMKHRPRLYSWIQRMQVKYYNRFICLFARDMRWKDQRTTLQTEPTPMFIRMKNAAVAEMEKPSTSAKVDDIKFPLFSEKTTGAIIAQ